VSERVDIKSFSHLVVAVGVIIYASQILEVNWTIGKAIAFILLFITSSLIVIAIMLLASASAFWIMIPNYALLLAVKLKDFSHYPVGIYSKFFRFLFTFIVPIGYVAFYPASFILRPDEATLFVYLSPLMGVVFFTLAYLIWTKGALRYSGTGT
jgi:ABC-2 type transport system permease protein